MSTCDTSTAFSIADSAGLYSQVTGVVGALVFFVLAMGFTKDWNWESRYIKLGFRTLITAFASLIVTSVLWALIAGTESKSVRASLLGFSLHGRPVWTDSSLPLRSRFWSGACIAKTSAATSSGASSGSSTVPHSSDRSSYGHQPLIR